MNKHWLQLEVEVVQSCCPLKKSNSKPQMAEELVLVDMLDSTTKVATSAAANSARIATAGGSDGGGGGGSGNGNLEGGLKVTID